MDSRAFAALKVKPMLTIFKELMTGLDEADAFLAGKKIGYEVTVPPEADRNVRQEDTISTPPTEIPHFHSK